MIRGSFPNNLRPICECCLLFVKADVSQKNNRVVFIGPADREERGRGSLALSSVDFQII